MAATAKKSSKKSTAKKATPKTASARATKKTTAKKAPVKKTASKVVVTKAKDTGPFAKIRGFFRGAWIVYLALAVAVVGFVSSQSSKITLTLQDRDLLAGGNEKVLTTASEVLANFQLKYVLATILVLSALGSLLFATKLRAKYEASVDNKTSGLRWLYVGITGGLTLEFVALLAGITDLMVLKVTAGLILVAALLAWLAERENQTSASAKWLAHASGIFAGFLAWLPILGSLIGTTVYGGETFAWYVYAAAGVVFLGALACVINQHKYIKGRITNFIAVEENYWRIDFLTKLALVVVIVSALYK